jgi:hypothetical protein
MLQHPAAIEGRELFKMLYADSAPAGLAGGLRAKGFRLMRSKDERIHQVGILLHGIAEAAERRR